MTPPPQGRKLKGFVEDQSQHPTHAHKRARQATKGEYVPWPLDNVRRLRMVVALSEVIRDSRVVSGRASQAAKKMVVAPLDGLGSELLQRVAVPLGAVLDVVPLHLDARPQEPAE